MSVEVKYDNMMERWDIQMLFQLGDLKDMVTVAHIEDNTITFQKPLSITDVYKILNKCEVLKHQLGKNPLDEIDIEEEREVHFELNPDE